MTLTVCGSLPPRCSAAESASQWVVSHGWLGWFGNPSDRALFATTKSRPWLVDRSRADEYAAPSACGLTGVPSKGSGVIPEHWPWRARLRQILSEHRSAEPNAVFADRNICGSGSDQAANITLRLSTKRTRQFRPHASRSRTAGGAIRCFLSRHSSGSLEPHGAVRSDLLTTQSSSGAVPTYTRKQWPKARRSPAAHIASAGWTRTRATWCTPSSRTISEVWVGRTTSCPGQVPSSTRAVRPSTSATCGGLGPRTSTANRRGGQPPLSPLSAAPAQGQSGTLAQASAPDLRYSRSWVRSIP